MLYLALLQFIFLFLISFNIIPITIPGIYPWRYHPIQHSFFIKGTIIYIIIYIYLINYMFKKKVYINSFLLILFILNIGLYLSFFAMHYSKKNYPYFKGITYIIENTYNRHQNNYYCDAQKIDSLKKFFSTYHYTLWKKQWGHGPFHPPGKILFCYAFQKIYSILPLSLASNVNFMLFTFQILIVSLYSIVIFPLKSVAKYMSLNDFQQKSLLVIYSTIPNIVIFSPKMDCLFLFFSILAFLFFLRLEKKIFILDICIFSFLIFLLSLIHFGVLSLIFLFFCYEFLYIYFSKNNNYYFFIKKILFITVIFFLLQFCFYFFTGYNPYNTFININKNLIIYVQKFFPHNPALTRLFSPIEFFLFIGITISFYFFTGLKNYFSYKLRALQISFFITFLCIIISDKSFQESSRVLIFFIPFLLLNFVTQFFKTVSLFRVNLILFLSITQTYIFKYYIIFYIF